MLIEFSVTNYKSFKDKTTFSMVADSSDKSQAQNTFEVGKTTLLKSAVIYGANASGKSNFVEAFRMMDEIISESSILSSTKKNPLMVYYHPFVFDGNSIDKETSFEIYFSINNIKYHYGFSYNEYQILEEFLYYFPNSRQTCLFKRNKDDYDLRPILKGEKIAVKNLTDKPQLYLSNGVNNKMPQLIEVAEYFNKKFVSLPFLNDEVDRQLTDIIGESLFINEFPTFSKNFKSLLMSLDTGIIDIEVEQVKNVDFNNNPRIYRIFTYHKYKKFDGTISQLKFQLERESVGTQKLFVIIAFILEALNDGRVLIIDEFERSIHPQISKFLLSLFNDLEINKRGAQLIVATHDTQLLVKDNNLRRDQVWFVEKDEFGLSDLFSLSDIKGVRDDVPFDKWYLSNRFGGVPNLKTFNFKLNFEDEPQPQTK